MKDLGGVASVQFYVDGVLKGTDVLPPYSITPDLTSLPDGSVHTLRVVAQDVVGRTNFAQSTFVIDKTPKVTILSPSQLGVTLSSPALLSASVEDGTGIARVIFTVDGSGVETYTPASANTTSAVVMTIAPLRSGVHTLTVSVTGVAGGTQSATQRFLVDASLPVSTLQLMPPNPGGTLRGTSTTNPYDPTDSKVRWRELWGNSVQPNFVIEEPSFPATQQVELFYSVDRAPAGAIDPNNSATYYRSVHPKGTETLNDIDQLGLLNSNPSLSGLALYPGKAQQAVEGVWFWHLMFQDADGKSSGVYSVPYGIDRTPPAAVTGLGAFSSSTADKPVSSTAWLSQDRLVLKWSNTQQDLLSGTAYYRVYRDGTCIVPGDVSLTDPVSGEAGVPWYREGRSQESLTLESVTAGKHSIQVAAVDRAGNESALQKAVVVNIDPDIPQIGVLTPSSDGARISGQTYLSVQTTDSGGVASVNFAIDGASVGTVKPSKRTTSYTANFKPAWSRFSNGKHRLTAKVTDMVGRQSSASRDFVLDKTPPSLSVQSHGGSLFYPRLRDDYKDNYKIKFKTGETASASMLIYDSKGKLRRTIKKTVKSGTSSLTWDGSVPGWDMGTASISATYKFTVKVRVADKVGNTRTSSGYKTSIRFYEIVKTGPNSARIVDR